MAADPGSPSFPRVLMATMAREHLNISTHGSILQCLRAGILIGSFAYTSGPYLDAGRNRGVALAIDAMSKSVASGDLPPDALDDWWFMFCDSDVEFTPDHLRILFAPVQHPAYNPTKYPVIGGVYVNPFDDGGVPGDETYGFPGHIGPVAYEHVVVDDLPGQLYGVPTPFVRRLSRAALATRAPVDEPWNPPGDNGSPSPVTAVHTLGTGFLAIHSSLLGSMSSRYGEPLPWFDEPVVDAVHYGEDYGFAFRCAEMGYPVLAHRGCTPLHHKTIKLI